MSQATVRVPAPLRSFTGGADEVNVNGQTVAEALQHLAAQHSGLTERILDREGQLRNFVNLYLNDQNVRTLDGLDSTVESGAVIHIVPAVAGGR